jgi:hypothetical protein
MQNPRPQTVPNRKKPERPTFKPLQAFCRHFRAAQAAQLLNLRQKGDGRVKDDTATSINTAFLIFEKTSTGYYCI